MAHFWSAVTRKKKKGGGGLPQSSFVELWEHLAADSDWILDCITIAPPASLSTIALLPFVVHFEDTPANLSAANWALHQSNELAIATDKQPSSDTELVAAAQVVAREWPGGDRLGDCAASQ